MEDKNTPVVIVHKGYNDYLKHNLMVTGKNNKIYLIGDKSVEKLGNIHNVTFIDISKYENDPLVNNLKKYFKNYSSYNFDWIWLAGTLRILVIYLFLKEYNFDQIFNTDSDNILLKDINSLNFTEKIAYNIMKNYDNEFRMAASIGNALINLEYCEKYIELYKQIYVTGEKFHLIKGKVNYHSKQKGGGGICEMTNSYLLVEHDYIKAQNLLKSFDNVVFMNHINNCGEGDLSKDQYNVENGIIKLYKKEGKTMLYDKIKKDFVEVVNIHFTGTTKNLLNQGWLRKNCLY